MRSHKAAPHGRPNPNCSFSDRAAEHPALTCQRVWDDLPSVLDDKGVAGDGLPRKHAPAVQRRAVLQSGWDRAVGAGQGG